MHVLVELPYEYSPSYESSMSQAGLASSREEEEHLGSRGCGRAEDALLDAGTPRIAAVKA